MILVIPSLVWFVMAIGFAVAFDSGYEILLRRRASAVSRAEGVKVYWWFVCLLSLLATANPLAPLSMLPIAVSQYDISQTGAGRATLSELLRNIPNALRRLWTRIAR